MMARILLFTLLSSFSSLADAQRSEEERVESFRSLMLTRSWGLGMWRVNNCVEHDEYSRNFKLSMTAEAFRYWMLVQEGLIEANLGHDAQIARSFARGELSLETLKNPLLRDKNGKGGFGVGIRLNADRYASLSLQFEAYVRSQIEQIKNKKENKSRLDNPLPRPESEIEPG